MNCSTQKIVLVLMLLLLTVTTFADEDVDENKEPVVTTTSSVILFDEIIISRPVEMVWPELLDFVSWYFRGQDIEHVKGQKGQLGSTFVVNDSLRHEIVSIRPLKTVVWKTCLISSCESNVVFSDFSIDTINGKTKLFRSSYSQGFWSEEMANSMREDVSKGIVPESVRKVSLAFKTYVESNK